MSSDAPQLDSTIDIVTPENIAFQYRAAGPFRRFPAYLLDVLLRVGVFIALLMLMGFTIGLSAVGMAVLLLLWFVLAWFYGGLFEAYMNGQTPGKWVLGVRVLTTSGQPVNGLQAVLRNVLRLVDTSPLLPLYIPLIASLFSGSESGPPPIYIIPTFLAGLVAMSLNSRYQRLGDLVCGTMVICEDRHGLTGVAKLEDKRIPALAELIPADFVVSRTMAQALSTYAERRRYFSPERRGEVAARLGAPLVKILGLREDTSHDLLLCAIYYRTFVTDRAAQQPPAESPFKSPFGPSGGSQSTKVTDAREVIQI